MRLTTPRWASASSRFLLPIAIGTLLCAAGPSWSAQVAITSVAGFPNGRTLNDLPPNAIDGNIATWTWTTNPNNIAAPSHLAIGFAATPVNRVRLWKEPNGGGGQNIKNLTIQYTTDNVSVPLSSRTWTTVTGLANGFDGSELMIATSVTGNGTVTGDTHNSTTGDGWASLEFTQVTATGLRVSFQNPNPAVPFCDGVTPNGACNHYRVAEFEAHMEGPVVPGAAAWGVGAMTLLLVLAGALELRRRRAGAAVTA